MGKSATSSTFYTWSTSDGLQSSSPSYAINGQNNHQKVIDKSNSGRNGYFPYVCTATATDNCQAIQAVWSVDLGDNYIIQNVTVYGFPLPDIIRK